MRQHWHDFPDSCLHCGGDAEVSTTAPSGHAFDGDEARCNDCGCPGVVVIDDNDPDIVTAHIAWHDEPNCDCDWCKAHRRPKAPKDSKAKGRSDGD